MDRNLDLTSSLIVAEAVTAMRSNRLANPRNYLGMAGQMVDRRIRNLASAREGDHVDDAE